MESGVVVMQNSAVHHTFRVNQRAWGKAGAFLIFGLLGTANAAELKLSMRLESTQAAQKRETPIQPVAVKGTADSPWYGGFTLGSIPARLSSVKHYLTTIRHHDDADTIKQSAHDKSAAPALALYNKTANALGLIPYGVSYALTKGLDIQYAGNSAVVGSGAPWQSLRMINKDDPNRHWYFAVDKIQFERKNEISAGVGVLLPLR